MRLALFFWEKSLKVFSCYDPQYADQSVYICLRTLAMGDSLAVEIAQQSHFNLLRTIADSMRPDEILQYRHPIPRGPFYELLTIDDYIRSSQAVMYSKVGSCQK